MGFSRQEYWSGVPLLSPQFRLDMLKNKVKRSLTESLESILSWDNKARGLQKHSASLGLVSSVSGTFSNTSKELSGCEKEALPISKSCFRILGSLDDLSSDSESQPVEERASPALTQAGLSKAHQHLSHVLMEYQEPLQLAWGSPGVSQRKLVRYHSVSTETPHESKNFESKADHMGDASRTSIKTQRPWRQQIFLRVATLPEGLQFSQQIQRLFKAGRAFPMISSRTSL